MDATTATLVLIQHGHRPEITPETGKAWLQAVKAGRRIVVEAYLALGMDIDFTASTSALILAVETNDLALGEWLIEQGIDLELVDASQDTALQTAVNWKDRRAFIELLLRHGARVNCLTPNGRTPLIKAIADERLDIVQLLLKAGADPDLKGADQAYPPLYHAHLSTPAIFEAVLDAGANPNFEAKGFSFLIHCCMLQDQDLAGRYLTRLLAAGADPNVRNAFGWTAWLQCHHLGRQAFLPILEAHGAAPSDTAPIGGVTTCFQRDAEALRAWLTLGLDVNARNIYGTPALTIAARNGDLALVELLLAAGADANLMNGDANALMWAISNRHEACARALLPHTRIFGVDGETSALVNAVRYQLGIARDVLAAGAQVNGRNSLGQTALLLACSSGDLPAAQWLIAAGADLNLADQDGFTPLLAAIQKGHFQVADFLLTAHGPQIDLDAQKKDGKTALHLAMNKGSHALVIALLAAGAAWTLRDRFGTGVLEEGRGTVGEEAKAALQDFLLARLEARTAGDLPGVQLADCADPVTVQVVIEQGRIDLLRLLLEVVPDLHTRRLKYGWSLLHLACSKNQAEMVVLLLAHGADSNVTIPDEGSTPLFFAKEAAVVRLLVAAGADVNAATDRYLTPLMALVWLNDVEVVRMLVEYGARINPHPVGVTPLLRACTSGSAAAAQWLLEHGANPNIVTADLECALAGAIRQQSAGLVELLIRYGANIEQANWEGETPILIAAREGFAEGVRLLLHAGANLTARTAQGVTLSVLARRRPAIAWTIRDAAGETHLIPKIEPLQADPLAPLPPLLHAVTHGDEAGIREHLATVNSARSYRGDTALILACALGNQAAFDLLLEAGADIHATNRLGENAWVYAATNGFQRMESRLLERGAKIDALDLMPSHMLRREDFNRHLQRGELEIVRQQVYDGMVNIDARTAADATPLCLAILRHDRDMVRLLLRLGANPNIPGRQDTTPLDLACYEGHIEMVRGLLGAGARLIDAFPLASALFQGHHEIVRLLYPLYRARGIPLPEKVEIALRHLFGEE